MNNYVTITVELQFKQLKPTKNVEAPKNFFQATSQLLKL